MFALKRGRNYIYLIFKIILKNFLIFYCNFSKIVVKLGCIVYKNKKEELL